MSEWPWSAPRVNAKSGKVFSRFRSTSPHTKRARPHAVPALPPAECGLPPSRLALCCLVAPSLTAQRRRQAALRDGRPLQRRARPTKRARAARAYRRAAVLRAVRRDAHARDRARRGAARDDGRPRRRRRARRRRRRLPAAGRGSNSTAHAQPSPRAAYSLFLTHRSSLTGVCSPHPHHALRSTHSRLQVEVRAGADSFGKGNRRRMRFGALLHKVGRPVLTRVAVANHRGLACASGRATAVPRPCRSACARHLPEAQCPGTAPAYVQRLARLLARHVQSLSRALAEP